MASCSIFRDFTTPVDKKALLLIGKDIISNKYKAEIEEIRGLIADGKLEEASIKKKNLPAFTPSAVFTERRKMDFLDFYSGFVHLDLDKLSLEELQKAKEVIAQSPYTHLCFVSPSGNGLKVFVKVSSGIEYHDVAYTAVKAHFETLTGLKADPSCKDITRLCFMSYDPIAYRNIENTTFDIEIPDINPVQVVHQITPEKEQVQPMFDLGTDFIFNQQVSFTNQKFHYEEGNRNNYIYALASNCNRAGLSQSDTELLCSQHFDLNKKEIEASVKSAYNHHPSEFGKFANLANKQSLQTTTPEFNKQTTSEEIDDYLKSTPTFPDELFDTLPSILKEGSQVFPDRRKRDVFFTSALSILSGCLPGVSGVYEGEKYYPHLFTFVIAPAASGKGVLKNAKRLGDKYHERVLESSRKAQNQFENEMVDYKETLRTKKKGDQTPLKPDEPKFKLVFIPADSSSARMIEHLQNNNGEGIICETEADTMSGAKKQDWGDYSPALRSSFQHEKITQSRKTNNEYTEIKEPRLAVCLSGTPAQAPRLIASSEDGLFSRFLFYAFKNDLIWQDPSPYSNKVNYNKHFDALSEEVLKMVDFLSMEETTFELTYDQWQYFNNTFRKHLYEVGAFTGEDAASVVFRLGLITFRIAMILSTLRKFDNGEAAKTIFCTDEDFDTSLKISSTFLEHSILMFNNLPKQDVSKEFKGGDNKRKFFEALPIEFLRQEAVALGLTFQLSTRTVDEILRNALGTQLSKIKAGTYRKINNLT
jgi:hypothetical protein